MDGDEVFGGHSGVHLGRGQADVAQDRLHVVQRQLDLSFDDN